jgi:Nickel responsive protein SCO4226-like
MPLFMIERTFADQLDLTDGDINLIEEINADEGVRWLFSFLSADRRRTYCLYESPTAGAIVAAARRGNIPADAVVEVGAGTPGFADRLGDWASSVQSP